MWCNVGVVAKHNLWDSKIFSSLSFKILEGNKYWFSHFLRAWIPLAPASASQVPAQKKYTLSNIIENMPQIAGTIDIIHNIVYTVMFK